MPQPFTYDQPAGRIVFGPGSLGRLGDELERLGSNRALLLPDAAMNAVAEAIALDARLPIIAVPTTYAGSEMTPVYGITEGGVKRTGRDDVVRPRTVIYDPELSRALPLPVSAASAINALAHCVDALWGPHANPVTEVLAAEGGRALRAGLSGVLARADDLNARDQLLYGASLAGSAFAVAGGALHHKVCHVLGGAFDLPHAETHAAVLPHSGAHNAPAMPQAQQRLAEAIAVDDLAGGLFDIATEAGVPTALAALGLGEDQLAHAAEIILAQPPTNPVPVTDAGIRRLLHEAWAGIRPMMVTA